MDIILRFWDKERQMVVSRYFTSEFFGHTKASDLLEMFMKGLESLNPTNMVKSQWMDCQPTGSFMMTLLGREMLKMCQCC